RSHVRPLRRGDRGPCLASSGRRPPPSDARPAAPRGAGSGEETLMIKTAAATLLDEVLPEFDFRSRHARRVDAPPEWVAEAVEVLQLGRAASLLFMIRGIHLPAGSTREVLTRSGFTVLADRPGVEVVAGTT